MTNLAIGICDESVEPLKSSYLSQMGIEHVSDHLKGLIHCNNDEVYLKLNPIVVCSFVLLIINERNCNDLAESTENFNANSGYG